MTTMTTVAIDTGEGSLRVLSPYHPDFPGRARALGGKWDGEAWTFDLRDESRVRDLCRDIYGTDGEEEAGDAVVLRATARHRVDADRAAVFLAGRCVARARSRDSGVVLGDGVAVLEGTSPRSGGSWKNWTTTVERGTVIEIRDVARAAAERAARDDSADWEIEIVETADERRAALRTERERLVARIAEIDALLAAASDG